jgi:2-keto-4-pentenoate hydratase
MTPVSYSSPPEYVQERDLALVNDSSGIAGRFRDARRAAVGLNSYPGVLPDNLDRAYAIQDAAIRGWNRPVVGWKVGRVPAPLSDRFGTDRLTGPVFAATPATREPIAMPVFAQGFAAGEAEFLLRIGTPPATGKIRFTLGEAADLIEAVHVGIEIASSPLGSINDLGPAAVISDFGNNNGLVIGPPVDNWRESGFEQWEVLTLVDGDEAGRGRAESFPDGAIGAARFLFELMAARGIALMRGQWISSGAVTGVHRARPGQLVECRFGDTLTVACRLVEARPE